MNETYEDFMARIAGLDEMAAARALAERHGLNVESIRRATRLEVDDRLQGAKASGRRRAHDNVETASVESLAEWLENGAEWAVDLDFAFLADFILGHRQACVWAVLTAKARTPDPGVLEALYAAATDEEMVIIDDLLVRMGWRCHGCGNVRPDIPVITDGSGECEDCKVRLAALEAEG